MGKWENQSRHFVHFDTGSWCSSLLLVNTGTIPTPTLVMLTPPATGT